MKFKILHLLFTILIGFSLSVGTIRGMDSGLGSFIFLLNRIESQTLFQPDKKKWLGLSLHLSISEESARPVSLNKYTQILENHLKGMTEKEKNLFLTRAVRDLLRTLPDPYAGFFSPAELAEERKEHEGGFFFGYGLELAERNGGVFVSGILPGSPAFKSKLSVGDRVVAIKGETVANLQDALLRLTVADHHPLDLRVQRFDQNIMVKLFPERLRLVPFSSRMVGKVGIIAMQIILPHSDEKFFRTVQKFERESARLLVLDWRNCLGGDVKSAVRIASFFLPPGDLLYTKESRTKRTPIHSIHAQERFRIPLVVLVNGATASAAELAAGALQDQRAASFYGERTLGKGSIQTTWILAGGWGLRLTTALYARPSGKEVQGLGITPDVKCAGNGSKFSCEKGEYSIELENLFR